MNQNDGLLTYLSTINPQKSPSINRCNWNGSSSAFGNNLAFQKWRTPFEGQTSGEQSVF
jgi:hypothetical protein